MGGGWLVDSLCLDGFSGRGVKSAKKTGAWPSGHSAHLLDSQERYGPDVSNVGRPNFRTDRWNLT